MHGVGAGVPPGKRGNVLHDDDFQMCRHYSTDGNAMMEVVQTVAKKTGFTVHLSMWDAGALFGECYIQDTVQRLRVSCGEGPTPHVAVCRAALAAMAGGGA